MIMAMPITISSRLVGQQDNKFFVAFSNFGLNESGFMVECEFDQAHDLPWGVRMLEIRDKGDFSLFGMMIKSFIEDGESATLVQRKKDAEQKFAHLMSSELSSMLNGFHGVSDMQKPIPITPSSFIEQLSEEVFSFGSKGSDENGAEVFEIVPMKIKMTELYNKPLVSLGFFKGLPKYILNPEAGVVK